MEEIELFCSSEEDPRKGEVVDRNGVKYILNRDPTGRRTGECPGPDASERLKNLIDHASTILSEHAKLETAIDSNAIVQNIKDLGEAVKAAYPEGIPDWEPVLDMIEDSEDLAGTSASKEVLKVEETALWLATKEILPGKMLSDYVGRNEKTKAILKVTKKSLGPPCQEPGLSEPMRKELLTFFNEKEKQLQNLSSHPEEDFENSKWIHDKRRDIRLFSPLK
ncbi:hypothetical protein HDU97_004874 [Phlyctochytrium planicorne]|nr:hypothetical protein HDU97_004874 [Phlyctochytrium planicorne]